MSFHVAGYQGVDIETQLEQVGKSLESIGTRLDNVDAGLLAVKEALVGLTTYLEKVLDGRTDKH